MRKFIHIWENKDRDGVTRIYLKSKEGVESFTYDWYFCVRYSDLTPRIKQELRAIKKAKKIKKFVRQGEWLKIYIDYQKRDNQVLRYIQSLMPTYEGDLKLWMRYLVDEDIELDIDQKILYFDIETNGLDLEKDEITCIGAIGSDGKRYQFFSTTDERSILKKFVALIDKYDILTGWNSETFDLVAIINRCKFHGIRIGAWVSTWSKAGDGGLTGVRTSGKFRARPQTFNHIDMMMKVKEMHYRDTELIKKVRSFSLDAVAKAFLPEQTHKMELPNMPFRELAIKEPELLKEYNMRDVEVLVELDKKLNVIKQKLIEHEVCNAPINDYTSHGKIDPYALRAARKMGEHFPSRPEKSEEEEFKVIDPALAEEAGRGVKIKGDYIGGLVFEPVKGLHKDVHVFDYQSLYPSIIKTFNVSLDVYLGKDKDGIRMPTGATFRKDKMGIIPTIIQNILDERNKIRFDIMKKLKKDSPEYNNWHYRQYSFKVLANSMYGIMGASFSRYFSRDLAEGITLTGQHLIKFSWDWMEKRGHTPIYGDSDSLFVKFGFDEDIEKLVLKLKKDLDKNLEQFNINDSHMQMDFEKKYDRFIMVAKKKYIGRAADGDMKITGLELKKRDTLPRAEQLQRQVLDLLLTGHKPKAEIVDIVEKLRYQVYEGKMKQADLTYQKRLSREIDKYGQESKKTGRKVPIPVWVKVAIAQGTKREISAGTYIPYIVTGVKPIQAVYADDFDGGYDQDYYWNAIFAPTQRVLEAVYPKHDWNQT